MNMLRDEDNAKYRSVIKNTLEFDPEILKRYVNFMNNPDERTAVDQFGKGDKYFGICTLMATMPGLPMFGHGQVEGFAEKYGMEYRRAYWDEQPDGYLVERHEREIFPLLRKRYLFAEVENFALYDLFTPEGHVNEDVFAYSNRSGPSTGSGQVERGLVVYHNKYAEARGWVRTSAACAVRTGDGEKMLVQKSLGEGLGLDNREDTFTIFRDHAAGLEYIRNNMALWDQGLYVELTAYKCQVFLDFRQVRGEHYAQLAARLDGRGVPSIDEALTEIVLQPVLGPFGELVNADVFRRLMATSQEVSEPTIGNRRLHRISESAIEEIEQKATRLFQAAAEIANPSISNLQFPISNIAREVRRKLEALLQLTALRERFPLPRSRKYKWAAEYLASGLADDPRNWPTLLGWLFVHALGKVVETASFEQTSRAWIDEWLLGRNIAGTLHDLGLDESSAWHAVEGVKLLTSHQRWFEINAPRARLAREVLQTWLEDRDVQRYLQINRHAGVLWFNKEAFDQLLWLMLAVAAVTISADPSRAADEIAAEIVACYDVTRALLRAEEKSDYQIEKLLKAV
jgi:hypothetical protein